MKWQEIETRWLKFRPLARRRWLALSDENLDEINGRRESLSEILQQRYGVSRDIAELEIDTWCATFDDEEHESAQYASVIAGPASSRPLSESVDMRRRTHPRR
jgi:uncharacterized protein YjbJ (UPF0337 family)